MIMCGIQLRDTRNARFEDDFTLSWKWMRYDGTVHTTHDQLAAHDAGLFYRFALDILQYDQK
jgi:hypothetical protein